MKEKSMTKNHGGGIIGGAIIERESLKREASGRHPPQGFPPSLSKENHKFHIEYYQFVVHGTQEIFQNVSKESENMVPK